MISSEVFNMDLFGRKKIFIGTSKEDLSAKEIGSILSKVLPIHQVNASTISYLRSIEKGNQEVFQKTKDVRPEINNQIVENHINHAVSFKKGYVFGYPSQYVQMTNDKEDLPPSQPNNETQGFDKTISQDLGVLNSFMRINDKASKDIELSDDLYTVGVGARYFVPTKDGFEFYNLNPTNAFVVYSNGYRKQPLFSVYMVVKTNFEDDTQIMEMQVTTRKNVFKYELPYISYLGQADEVIAPIYIPPLEPKDEINALGFIPIIEYELNKDRISITERMLSVQNALNQLSSSEVDDVEQFVQAMMVFMNAEIDEKTLKLAKQMGAVNVKSQGTQKGDVKLLTSKLDHSGVKTLYDRLYQTMLTNVGVPLVNVSGGSGGDTGLARLTDNGWLMADTKAREDELSFVLSEKPMLEMAIEWLKRKNKISKLGIENIETKFTRHKSDNLLVKVQALQSMVGVVHPMDAFAIADLFSDSDEAVAKARDFYGDNFFHKESKDKIQEPTTKIEEKVDEEVVEEE